MSSELNRYLNRKQDGQYLKQKTDWRLIAALPLESRLQYVTALKSSYKLKIA
jgi:hypothetical protein